MRLFVVFFFFTGLVFAQEANKKNKIFIEGQLVDTLSREQLEFVSVRLFSAKDSSVVGGALTDTAGKFKLDAVAVQQFYLKLSFVGYETKVLSGLEVAPNSSGIQLGKIGLRPSSIQELSEVKVIGELDVFKTGIDKKIYNVGEDLNTQGGSVSDALNNVPSVDVDQDGNVSLRGDGNVIILVDGRPSTLTLSGGLSGLPANSIERIEVVTNPSAKYDPDGTSGIINIVLKKSQLRGVNGTVGTTFGTGNLFNGNVSVNVRTNKINVFANYGYNYNEGYRNFFGSLERTDPLGAIFLNQDRPGKQNTGGHNLRVGIEYFFSEKQTLGFSVNGANRSVNRYSLFENTLYDASDLILNQWNRNSFDYTKGQNLDFNLSYKNKFANDGGELSVYFTSSTGLGQDKGEYQNAYQIDNYTVSIQNDLRQKLSKKDENTVHTAQLDYVKVLEKRRARIETGVKGILRDEKLNTISETYDDLLATYQSDTLANFRYQYHEKVLSYYFIWGQQINRWKYQIGVRGEYAQQIPYLIDENSKITNDYFNLFPSSHLRYELKKKQELSLSYSRRINRASSNQLNPFINYSDPLNLRKGNPYLSPEYVNSFDLGYSIEKKKLSLSTSAFYRSTVNVIQRVKIFYNDATSAISYENIDKARSYGFEMVVNYKPLNWWKNTLAVNGDHTRYDNSFGEGNFNNSGYNLSVKYSGTVDFWKKTASFQVNVRYNTPRITPQGKVLPRSVVDLSGDKRFNDHWTMGFRVSDVFNTQGFRYNFQQNEVRQQGEYKWLTRRFYLTITYKFGHLEINKKEGHATDGGFDY